MRLRILAAAIAMFAATLSAKADTVLYSQPYNTTNGYFSYAGSYNAADSFSLATTATINSASFYGVYAFGTPTLDAFLLNIYSSVNGAPGTLLDSITTTASKTDTGTSVDGYEIYRFSSSLPDFLATAGTSYFFQTVSTSTTAGFAWSTATGGDGTHEVTYPGASGYSSTSDDLAFSLSSATAATPEPSSLALLGTGVLGVIGAVRRRMA